MPSSDKRNNINLESRKLNTNTSWVTPVHHSHTAIKLGLSYREELDAQRPHLFKAPPITTTTNIAINDSCNWDRGDKNGTQENPASSIVSCGGKESLQEGMLD
jgi:hypothetical protein